MPDQRTSQPLALSDEQLTELFRLAKPLQPACREEFLQRLAQALQGRTEIGPGELYRTAVDVIKTNHLFTAPSSFETSLRGRRRA